MAFSFCLMYNFSMRGDSHHKGDNMAKLKDILAELVGKTLTEGDIREINRSVDEIKTKATNDLKEEYETLKKSSADYETKLKDYTEKELKAKFKELGGSDDRYEEFTKLGGNIENVETKLKETEYFKVGNKQKNDKDITSIKTNKEEETKLEEFQMVSGRR